MKPMLKPHFTQKFALSVLATTLFMLTGPAQAHDVVIVPEAGQLRVKLGHPGDWQPVDLEKLLELHTMQDLQATKEMHSQVKRQGLDFVLKQKPMAQAQLAAARYDNGLWLELPAVAGEKPQWRNASRFMLPNATGGMASVKYAKAYRGNAKDNAIYKRPAGHLLELIPQTNPLTVAPGQMLAVQLLFNGKPLADAGIELSDLKTKMKEDEIERFKTDANGMANIPKLKRGVNMLAVDVKRPNDGSLGAEAKALPVADILMVATYTFVRP